MINAIVHNDYFNEVSPKFELFSDRLEITSAGTLPFGMSKTDFFNGVSNPRNKELMRVFRDVDMVEALGTGMLRVLKVYKEENFVFMDNFIRVVIPYNWLPSELSNGSSENKTVNVAGNNIHDLSERQLFIMDIMIDVAENVAENVAERFKVNTKYLSERLGVNRKTVQRDLVELVEKHLVRWVGSDKTGHWKVIKTIEKQESK